MTIKNLMITVPTIGRISIGHIVEKDDKRLPAKDDRFTITTQFKKDGEWVLHPIGKTLTKPEEKLRAIPVRLMFNNPDLSFRANYELFDRGTKRQLCVGDGDKAKRINPGTGKIEDVECVGSDRCEFGKKAGCKIMGRLNVQIDGQKNDFATFIHRTRGYNATKALSATIRGLSRGFPGLLAGLPLTLKLRGKASALSHGSIFYYSDLEIRDGMSTIEAAEEAAKCKKELEGAGFQREAFEASYLEGIESGAFAESEEEADELEEFLLEGDGDEPKGTPGKKGARLVSVKSGNDGGTGLESLRRGLDTSKKPPEDGAAATV